MLDLNRYRNRVTRLGNTPVERLENSRRRNFELFLKSSPHYVSFYFNRRKYEAVLEPDRQSEIKNQMNLLCRVSDLFNIGDILEINENKYLVFYLKERSQSGYNNYAILKMSHFIQWTGHDGKKYSSDAYMYFQQDNMLQNETQSRSRSDTVYKENLKLYFLILPTQSSLDIDVYLEITTTGIEQHFRVTGHDIVSTPGVMYVSMDPTYKRDLSPAPERTDEDSDEDFFWLNGGKTNGN